MVSTPTTTDAFEQRTVEMVRHSNPGEAMVIDGAALAREVRSTVASRVAVLRTANPRFMPHMAIVQVGSRPDSTVYVQMKVDVCNEVGIKCTVVQLPGDASVKEVVDAVKSLNTNESVNGIFLQLPLWNGDGVGPEGEQAVIESISLEKDVDGIHPYNIGRLSSRAPDPLNATCMPAGVIRLIEKTGVSIDGTHTMILGTRSVVLGLDDVAGSPLAAMLRKRGAMVTQCDSWHKNLETCLKTADIVIVAIGKSEFVRGDMLKPGCVLIDIGINYVPDSTRRTGQKLVGDVHYESASKVASWITPVPGGIGPLIFATLVANTLRSTESLWEKGRETKTAPLPAKGLVPVPRS